MVKCSEVYTFSDQPTTCPYCGARTEILLELLRSANVYQVHKCLSVNCGFEFIVEDDN